MIIEPYRFHKPLGRGSFGEVWRVEFCKAGPCMGRLFAAKISYLPAEHEDTQQEMRESIPIITANHPHILRLLTGEGYPEGPLLLTMELADDSLLDRSLLWRATKSVFPLNELILYVRQAAEALDYIHGQNLVHGGINPGDILLLNGQAKIADPGPPIASDHFFARIQAANLSKAICMAPERKRGCNHIQSDQYALAATYTWLRAGRPVFGLDSEHETIQSINCLSQSEQEVLLKALFPDPDCRYPSCIEFVDALKHAIKKEKGTA